MNPTDKKIAMIIAFRDFRDKEYFLPKEIFEGSGFTVKTVSDKLRLAIGADGGEAIIDFPIGDLNPSEFDAIVFIGGPGTVKHLDNEAFYNAARKTISAGKVLAAICVSPVVLAKAGVLSGKRAAVWSSPMDKSAVRILEKNGAKYSDEPVVADGKIITASGPSAAGEFAKTIVKILSGN